MVEGYAMGRSADELSREMLRVLGDQATTIAASEGGPEHALRIVSGRGQTLLTFLDGAGT